jgi:hypothetical protein
MFKIVFWNVEVHMLRNKKGRKHPVRRYKKMVSRIARGYGHRAESETESYVKEDEMYLKKETD